MSQGATVASLDVIIPAYNEEKTIGAVVAAARACPLVGRVLVVDDGSQDRTAAVARAAGAEVLAVQGNQGKTAALVSGARAATAPVVMLLDADLIGIAPSHLEALAAPVLSGQAAMSIGVFLDGRWITDLSQSLTPFLNGQRVLRRELLAGLECASRRRYAADALLSLHARRLGVPVCRVRLPGLTHVMKEEKLGWVRGFLARLAMFGQVIAAVILESCRRSSGRKNGRRPS